MAAGLRTQGRKVPNLAHSLRGYNPSRPGGHGRVHGGRELEPGTLHFSAEKESGRGNTSFGLAFFFFLIFVVQSNAQPMGHHHMSSLPS